MATRPESQFLRPRFALLLVAAHVLAWLFIGLAPPGGCTTIDTKELEESECYDGQDNDGDGQTDCQDSDCYNECQSSGDPTPEVCNNGEDDDSDGLYDCEDSDCHEDPACAPAEQCPTLALGQCQEPDMMNALISDRAFSSLAEDFMVAEPFEVGQVCWWGGKPLENTDPDSFRIRYFEDASGAPASLIASFSESEGTLDVQSSVSDPFRMIQYVNDETGVTTQVYSMTYTGTHDPLPVSAGTCYWIEISNADDWGWETSNQGDYLAAYVLYNEVPEVYYSSLGGDFAFCVKPAPATGACCLGVECIVSTEVDCAGVYQGDGTDCDPDPCTAEPMGGCCNAVIGCYLSTEVACDGVYLGDGTDCGGAPPCPDV